MMILKDIKSHASAFGVAACVGLLLYLLSPSDEERNKADQNKVTSPAIVQESLTPSEITDRLKAITTSSMNEKAAQDYISTDVEWNLYFKNILKKEENNVHLLFIDSQDLPHYTRVFCVVSLDNNKILNVIEEGMLLKVIGQISKIDPTNNSIELQNVNLITPAE